MFPHAPQIDHLGNGEHIPQTGEGGLEKRLGCREALRVMAGDKRHYWKGQRGWERLAGRPLEQESSPGFQEPPGLQAQGLLHHGNRPEGPRTRGSIASVRCSGQGTPPGEAGGPPWADVRAGGRLRPPV